MRTCPVCGARCFDDMEVCYGCMHRFDERDEAATAVLQPLAKELASPEVSSTASASSLAGDSGTPPTAETVAGRSFRSVWCAARCRALPKPTRALRADAKTRCIPCLGRLRALGKKRTVLSRARRGSSCRE